MTYFTAFLLSPETRRALIERFPPLYPQIKADHITYEFGPDGFGSLFHPETIEITGIADSGDGLQTLVVTVDGEQFKPDGRPYHITWSLDPAKYSAVDSNILAAATLESPEALVKIDPPIQIEATPALIQKNGSDRIITELPQSQAFQHPSSPSPR